MDGSVPGLSVANTVPRKRLMATIRIRTLLERNGQHRPDCRFRSSAGGIAIQKLRVGSAVDGIVTNNNRILFCIAEVLSRHQHGARMSAGAVASISKGQRIEASTQELTNSTCC